jgi:hypothetical protein
MVDVGKGSSAGLLFVLHVVEKYLPAMHVHRRLVLSAISS